LRYEEASFVKLRNVTLGYKLPADLLKRVKIDNMRIYVTGKNLHTFSNIRAYDPEGNGSLSNPLTKLFVAGVNIGF
jgi:TonB-dependent starch-binding outer membrane protein SusC